MLATGRAPLVGDKNSQLTQWQFSQDEKDIIAVLGEVGAFISGGHSRKIVSAWGIGRLTVVISRELQEEIMGHGKEGHFFPGGLRTLTYFPRIPINDKTA